MSSAGPCQVFQSGGRGVWIQHWLLGLFALSVAGGAPLSSALAGARSETSSSSPAATNSATNITIASGRAPQPAQARSAIIAVTQFSDPPTDDELLACAILPQPLAPIGGGASAEENRALARTLIQYQESQQQGGLRDAVGPLTDFIRSHPGSRWRAALYLNLGIVYRETGHMSRALQAWQRAWDLSKHATGPTARAIADYSVGELAEFEAYLGRTETLAPLLAEVRSRPMRGTGAEFVSNASQGLAAMRTRPGDAFRCGPMALYRICLLKDHKDGFLALETSRSTTRGNSLTQVAQLAHQIGLGYRMAYRTRGASVFLPAVMHWKVGHFAALLEAKGGFYHVGDATFGEDIWISRATLEEEASGYFVVAADALPKGWRAVSAAEGNRIWGRGVTEGGDTGGTSPCDPGSFGGGGGGCSDCGGGGGGGGGGLSVPNVQAMLVGLSLHDIALRYQTPKGPPFRFELYYSHRDAEQPAMFTYTNFGPKWTSNWISYVTDNTGTNGRVDIYTRGGGDETYSFSGNVSSPGQVDQAIVTKLVSGGVTTGFTRQLPDGWMQTYMEPFGTNQYFLTSVQDPQGNAIALSYDSHHRITTITDPIGEKTRLTYGLASDIFKVTRITDPFGRSASFTYNSQGELASITDVLGIKSSYTYLFGSGDFIESMTTPYGTTRFTYGDATTDFHLGTTRFVTITDPLGQTERVEFRDNAPGIASIDPVNTVPTGMTVMDHFLNFRNTFVWDKHQLELATNPDGTLDFTKARIMHWLHSSNFMVTSRVLESIKQPLENRIWFNYAGQPQPIQVGSSNLPTAVGRVLDDGTTQLLPLQRNSIGHVTQFTDQVGRQVSRTYAANETDVTAIANTTGGANQVLFSATYNSQHEPLRLTDAAGESTKRIYNSAGQPLMLTDALSHTTSLSYDTNGFLRGVQGPVAGATNSFTYDGFNRIKTATNELGYTRTFSYDEGDRITTITYPDGTTRKFTYKLLDLASVTDRMNRTTSYQYDADRRLTAITDPLERTIKFQYCPCDGISALIDGAGNTTNFSFDLENRITERQYADGSKIAYAYEATTSRLKGITDALGQNTTYSYNLDNTLSSISFSKALNPTPAVSFKYDPDLARVVSMTDGNGTTTYTYNPVTGGTSPGANLLASETGPFGNVISYQYDALGRLVGQSVDGVAQTRVLDAISRATTVSNKLDVFKYAFVGGGRLLSGESSSHGPALTISHYGVTGDDLTQQIAWQAPQTHNQLASFSYAYDADHEVTRATLPVPISPGPGSYDINYDSESELLSLAPAGNPSNLVYAFTYSAAFNLNSARAGTSTQNFTYNKLNELSISGASYDADGDLTALGGTQYVWNALNQLVEIKYSTGAITQFRYDGLGRRTEIIESKSGVVSGNRRYVWCGSRVCQENDATKSGAPVTKRYFSQGVQINGTPFYYTFDRLGSIIQLIDATGAVRAQYEYDPYGNRVQNSGTVSSDIGYAGLFEHQPSRLALAVFRQYAPTVGRWLNRDPLGEFAALARRPTLTGLYRSPQPGAPAPSPGASLGNVNRLTAGDPNVFSYVLNSPMDSRDPLGLEIFLLDGAPGAGDEGPLVLECRTEQAARLATGALGVGGTTIACTACLVPEPVEPAFCVACGFLIGFDVLAGAFVGTAPSCGEEPNQCEENPTANQCPSATPPPPASICVQPFP